MYYIKIIGFKRDLEEGDIFEDGLYIKIQYNNLVRTTVLKYDSYNWDEIFIFEEEPMNIKILLMEKDDIKKQGDLPINKTNDLIDITFNGIKNYYLII